VETLMMGRYERQSSRLMEDRSLPIFIEVRRFPENKKAKITAINPRTRCTRLYSVVYEEDGRTVRYKGAAVRPRWIAHILKHPKQKPKETTKQ
jgi:hypothetical protein